MSSCNHNYTTDDYEHGNLVDLGWKDEGIAWYGIAPGYSDPASLSYDVVSGLFYVTGASSGSTTAVRNLSLTPTEMHIDGYLFEYGAGRAVANRFWTFGVNKDTEYGYWRWSGSPDGYCIISRDEFASMFSGDSFVAITLEIENGIVKRATEKS